MRIKDQLINQMNKRAYQLKTGWRANKVQKPVYWETKAERYGRDYWTNKLLGF